MTLSATTIDGRRLTEEERLRMLNDEEHQALEIQAQLAALRRRDANRYAGMSCAQVLKAFEAMGFAEVRISRGAEGVVVEGVVDEIPGHLRETA